MKKILLYSLILLCSNARATDFFISNSGTGSGTSLSPWSVASFFANYRASTAPGNRYFFNKGETFTCRIIKVNGTSGARIYFGAYGSGANPVFNSYTNILMWSLYSTNIYVATITNAASVTGYLATSSNVGILKVDGVKKGDRRASLSGLVSQWQYYCDFQSKLYVYSTTNPSTHSIQAAVGGSNIVNLGNYTTWENIDVTGDGGEGLQIIQPLYDTIRNCTISDIGGEMKTLSDSVRQGACISLYAGGNHNYVGHVTLKNSYEDACTPQSHPGAVTPILFSDNLFEYITSDSCENGFNATIEMGSTWPGHLRDTVRNCRFNNAGYTWAHPPLGKPVDNMAAPVMSHGWTTTDNGLVFKNDTLYNPRVGVYFLAGISTTVPFTSINNEVYMDSLTLVRRNCATCGNTYTWKFNEGNNGTWHTASGSDLGTNWHCLDCHVVGSHTYFQDADGDGFGNAGVTSTGTVQPVGYVNNSDDCNDADATVSPNTKWYLDQDGDGYFSTIVTQCTSPGTGWTTTVLGGPDCDDNSSSVNPGAVEVCDGIDNNCDGFVDNSGVQVLYYRDNDGDGYGDAASSVLSCAVPSNYVSNNTDCNDNSASVNPGTAEVCGNGVDDNCNGQIDEGCGTSPAIFIADTTGNESDGTIYVRIYLSALSGVSVSVDYYSVNGTATFPRDFKQVKSTAVIPAGSLSVLVPIKVVYDKILEPTEVFSVLLKNPINGLISDNQGDASIINTP